MKSDSSKQPKVSPFARFVSLIGLAGGIFLITFAVRHWSMDSIGRILFGGMIAAISTWGLFTRPTKAGTQHAGTTAAPPPPLFNYIRQRFDFATLYGCATGTFAAFFLGNAFTLAGTTYWWGIDTRADNYVTSHGSGGFMISLAPLIGIPLLCIGILISLMFGMALRFTRWLVPCVCSAIYILLSAHVITETHQLTQFADPYFSDFYDWGFFLMMGFYGSVILAIFGKLLFPEYTHR